MPKHTIDAPICPRCGGYIPSNDRPGEYMGAISRVDRRTEICSKCGRDEAMMDLRGIPYDFAEWGA